MISMRTSLLLTTLLTMTLMATPFAAAGALPELADCDTGGSIERATCAVRKTIENVGGVVQPIKDYVDYEVAWAVGFVFGTVGEVCYHIDPNMCAISTVEIRQGDLALLA